MRKYKILLLLLVTATNCGVALAQDVRYKSVNDTVAAQYLRGGYVRGGKLHLTADANYQALDVNRKREVLSAVADEVADMDIVVHVSGQQREMWHASDAGAFLVEEWDNDNPKIEEYQPLSLKRKGNSKWFYYVGGGYDHTDEYSSGSLILRTGSYLYKKMVDASVSLSIGFVDVMDTARFSGSIGLDGRYYLPFKPQKINLSPYAGGGVAWTFASYNYFELRMLAGVCWFVGPGSVDMALQYGFKSGFTATLGYTFRPGLK